MESKVKFAGHPVHPMLIVFPLGLLATAVIFDIIYLVSDNSQWTVVAYYMIGAGIIGGLAAAVFGWLDSIAIPGGTRARKIGLWHGIGNVVVLGLFILSWVLRRENPDVPPTGAIVAGLTGVVIALATAVCFALADPIARVLGKTGINVMTRLMGLILAALAVEVMSDGLVKLFPILGRPL